MRKPEQKTNRGTGGLRARIGTKLLAGVATFSLVASMCPGAATLAYTGDQLAAGLADAEEQVITAQADEFIEVTEQTHRMTTGTYRVTRDVTIKYDRRTNNGIQVEKGAKVLLIIDEGKTLTVIGSAGAIFDCGYAGILLPKGSTLTVAGKGTLNATGGKAGMGQAGGGAGLSLVGWSDDDSTSYTSNGGVGGKGGGGAGGTAADGIGSGGTGGGGGGGGASANIDGECAIFGGADLDDLWGYGGFGGTSTWGGAAGARGFYGATGKGESTNASTKYAKSGGSGGTSAAPKAVAFYTYKSSSSDTPKATSTPSYGGAPRSQRDSPEQPGGLHEPRRPCRRGQWRDVSIRRQAARRDGERFGQAERPVRRRGRVAGAGCGRRRLR